MDMKDIVSICLRISFSFFFIIYRSNVNYQTPCQTPLETGVWKRIRLNGKAYLDKTSIFLAIEVHPTNPTGYTDAFKAVVMPLLQNDDNRLVDVTVESNIEAASGTSVNNIVDGISSTYFSATVPANEHFSASEKAVSKCFEI